MVTSHRRFTGVFKRSNDSVRLIITTIMGMVFGYFIGISFPSVSLAKISLPSSIISSLDVAFNDDHQRLSGRSFPENLGSIPLTPKIYVPTNPRGAESLPPGIVVAESDFYLRRLWGEPSEDLRNKPKYLVTFTVGLDQKNNIDACVKKFSEDFQILLFHYDGRTSEWDQFEWSKRAVHISIRKQTKWWYAKRFLHPDVVAAYDYIFIWDEDLGVEHFNAEKYIQLVKKHGLEISQPGLEPNNGLTWQMTKRRGDREVHKSTEEKPGWCSDPRLPPCAAFVEIMAPVFSREAWRCVWHLIQNDLVHGWGLDFALRRCVEPAHEKIGVVDSQWIVHQVIPSLGSQGSSENGKAPWEGVRVRCRNEWTMFQDRLANADKAYYAQNGKTRDPVRSAVIDSCIRVTDNGRESIQRKVVFIFTLYNASNHNDQLKLGANSPEEAARWIQALQEAALKADMNKRTAVDRPRRDSQSLRLNCSNKSHHLNSVAWTFCSSSVADATTSDVVAPSSWTIFGCQNGLRLFKEAKDRESHGKWNDHPAIMAVGVVDGTSEAIFQTLMSLGPSRSEWDFCHYKGSVIEHLDGHTDIVHKLLRRDWLPWSMRKRDLLLQRYWRREDDGTYVILYHSVFHQKCPCQKGYVRACLKSGGYVISPVNQKKQSVVKHMLAIDWRFWKSNLQTSSARYITIHMLGRLAALRELFIAKLGDCSSSYFLEEHVRDKRLQQIEEVKVEIQTIVENGKNMADMEEEVAKSPSEHASLMGLNDASDEFFDVSEPLDYDQSENGWPSDFGPEMYSQDTRHARLSSAAGFVKKLHDLAVHKRGYVDLHEKAKEDALLCHYGSTLPKDPTLNFPCSWAQTDPSTFLIRGETYLEDRKKIKAKGTLMQMVAADWLKSDKREDDLGGRPGGIVQKYAAKGGPEFFFIVNIQVPGSTTYTLALYYMMDTPIENAPLLESFVKGDDAFRNSRFKLIPYISKGPWIVKQSVGKKACLVGPALEINYFRGKNYLELDINVGSSTVARGVVSLVVGYLNNLVIEMAFLIQANTPEELPEYLLATCRLNHLDISKAVQVKP